VIRIPRDLRDYARAATRQGWTITQAGSGHLKWKNPQGLNVITSFSPRSCGHGFKAETLRRLRKLGLVYEERR